MRRVLTLLLAGVLLLAGCTSGRNAGDSGTSDKRFVAAEGTSEVFDPADRRAAPKVTGELLDGGSFDLADLRGDVVVLNYWASWCAPCRLEAPELRKVADEYADQGVQFVGINIRDEKDKARAFEESFGIEYPSVFDPAGRIALKFRDVPPNTIPATIVIDRRGRVAAVFRKAVLAEELEPVVRDIATEKTSEK